MKGIELEGSQLVAGSAKLIYRIVIACKANKRGEPPHVPLQGKRMTKEFIDILEKE